MSKDSGSRPIIILNLESKIVLFLKKYQLNFFYF